MDQCSKCHRTSSFTVRCGHGITCFTYEVCGTHLSWAVRKILKDDPASVGVRVDED